MHSPFCADDETQTIFLQTDTSSYAAENSGLIQPWVVLCCEYNTIMRIYTKIQSIVESMISFVRITKHGQMFLQPDMSSYVPENSGLIQPWVVLCCEYNTIMRIYTKIQLVVELNLVFYGFINIVQTYSKNEAQPVVVLDAAFQVLMS